MRRRRASFGLRGRVVLALMATSVLTLAVAAFALLSPLERRLRNDQIETLTQSAVEARLTLSLLDSDELTAGSVAVTQATREIARRAHAQAVVVDARGRVLAQTERDPTDHLVDARRAIAEGTRVRQIVGDGSETEARVALPMRADGRTFAVALRRPLDDVHTAVAVVRRAMVTAALVALAVALVTGIGLAGRLVRRLRAVRDTALRVARLGPVVDITPDQARDEVGDLSRALAVMQERLREQEAARRTFVSTASHELRTPLTSLQLMLELLREELATGRLDAGEVGEQVARASQLTTRLGGLAAQLLDLSRLDAGLPLRRELIDLRETCRAVIAEFSARARQSDRRIELGGERALWAIADPVGVAQVVRVLLDNALHFAPPGTAIEVELTSKPHSCAVRVHDRGPGVPPAEREQIFERFRRGSQTGGERGFGLGLAIARETARRMDGDVVLADAGDGGRFELRLDDAPAPTAV
jgi:signal transduction histidine kinase